ncbi:MAG: HEPN domain-containing protein [Candidatus Methanoperedens sp.]|nr:HEPN domain-containing protein [Candidatus Methanoperedens sp.]
MSAPVMPHMSEEHISAKTNYDIFMKNIQKTRDWLHMALKEFDAAFADFMDERYSESIQHAQQCAERVGKSILSFLGFAPEKTHHPSDYIVEEILQHPEVVKKVGLSEDEVKYLVDMVTFSSPLERQGTMPRYGWETKERIITPDEIYKKEIATVMMKNAFELLIKSCEFYRLREMDGILASKIQEIEDYVEKHEID